MEALNEFHQLRRSACIALTNETAIRHHPPPPPPPPRSAHHIFIFNPPPLLLNGHSSTPPLATFFAQTRLSTFERPVDGGGGAPARLEARTRPALRRRRRRFRVASPPFLPKYSCVGWRQPFRRQARQHLNFNILIASQQVSTYTQVPTILNKSGVIFFFFLSFQQQVPIGINILVPVIFQPIAMFKITAFGFLQFRIG